MATDSLDITSNDWRILKMFHGNKLQIRFHLIWLDICWGILFSTSGLWSFSGEIDAYLTSIGHIYLTLSLYGRTY